MGYDLVFRAQIERLLYLKDRDIARYLNCALSRVRHVRASTPARKISVRSNHDSILVSEDAVSGSEDARRKNQAAQCDRLLRRQLKTGQCVLDAPSRRALMIERGWAE